LAVDAGGDVVALAGLAAADAPGSAMHALGLHVDGDRRERAHHLLGAEAPALPARAAGVLAQREALDEDRILRFELLAGAVVRVAVVRADHAAHAVAGVPRAPAAAGRAAGGDVEAAVAGRDAMDQREDEVGMVRGR